MGMARGRVCDAIAHQALLARYAQRSWRHATGDDHPARDEGATLTGNHMENVVVTEDLFNDIYAAGCALRRHELEPQVLNGVLAGDHLGSLKPRKPEPIRGLAGQIRRDHQRRQMMALRDG